jgi:hypothetical protein
MSAAATDKQVRYALHLLGQKGYSTRFMDARFKQLGATMRQRSGTVENWLRKMNVVEIGDLIDELRLLPDRAEVSEGGKR